MRLCGDGDDNDDDDDDLGRHGNRNVLSRKETGPEIRVVSIYHMLRYLVILGGGRG